MNLVVDTSALVAILFEEPDAREYLDKLLAATTVWISPVNWWEVQVRIGSRYGDLGIEKAEAWMEAAGIVIEPVTAGQANVALDAFARYQTPPASLNMGDCFAYALARVKEAPLLFKGDAFHATDLDAA